MNPLRSVHDFESHLSVCRSVCDVKLQRDLSPSPGSESTFISILIDCYHRNKLLAPEWCNRNAFVLQTGDL